MSQSNDTNHGRIDFEKLENTRDLGGIHTSDNRQIKRRSLLRSGALNNATEKDIERLLDEYNLRTVVDLRTEMERAQKPDPIDKLRQVTFVEIPLLGKETVGITRESHKAPGAQTASETPETSGSSENPGAQKSPKTHEALKDFDASDTDEQMMETARKIGTDPIGLMTMLYPKMVLESSGQEAFRAFFNELLESSDGSFLWHCTMGKDRVGITTYLLLITLGVPAESAIQDYLATNKFVHASTQEIMETLAAMSIPPQVEEGIHVINSADVRFLQAALDAIDSTYGTLDTFFHEVIGIDEEKKQELRGKYLAE